jgi:hypothetical protein
MRDATAALAKEPSANPPTQLVEWFVKTEQLIRVPEEKRQWLAGLANLRDPEALRLVGLHLKDHEVQPEAELAAVQIAQNLIAGPARGEAMTLLQSLARTASNSDVRKRSADIVSR